MKSKNLLLAIFILPTFFIFSEKIEWNVSNSFNGSIYETKNTEMIQSQNTPMYYKITKESLEIDKIKDKVDLYLSFDRNEEYEDITKNHTVLSQNIQYRETTPYIKSSAFFYKNEHIIELEGKKGSVFTSGKVIESFTINLYVFPLDLSENSTLFRIGSHFYDERDDSIADQSISLSLNEGVVRCDMKNVFHTLTHEAIGEVTLESYNRILPSQWNNITLVYDSFYGTIKIYLNGVENAIIRASEDGTNDTSRYMLYFDPRNRCILSIGKSFVGAIDEFLIKQGAETNLIENGYSLDGGEITSTVIKLDDVGVRLKSLKADGVGESDSSTINYYVRYSNFPFSPDGRVKSRHNPKWIPLNSIDLDGKRAKYFQWKAVLLPGISGKSSPSFRGITLEYDVNLPPAKPTKVEVFQEGRDILIKWNKSTEKDFKGYKIYYGTKPEFYFCDDADQGSSPIVLSNRTSEFRLSSLKAQRIYYIAITTFDDEDGLHESEFSDEVYFRVTP